MTSGRKRSAGPRPVAPLLAVQKRYRSGCGGCGGDGARAAGGQLDAVSSHCGEYSAPASFGLPGQPRSAARPWCSTCGGPSRPPKQALLYFKKKLLYCECGSQKPSFGLPGEPASAARWCFTCPSKPMKAVDIRSASTLCDLCGSSYVPVLGQPPVSCQSCGKCRSSKTGREAVDTGNTRTCECGRVSSCWQSFGPPSCSSTETAAGPSARPWCSTCPIIKPVNEVSLKSKRCEYGSMSQPSFGLPGEAKSSARWCAKCPSRPAEAVNIFASRGCKCGGSSQPSFGLPGEPKSAARWCFKCPSRPAMAINVQANIESRDCDASSTLISCGVQTGLQAKSAGGRRCSKFPSKPNAAVDLKHKRCECGSSVPGFGLPGEPKSAARWCLKCPSKPLRAVDIRSKRCECGSSVPSFGLPAKPGGPKPSVLWCSKCPSKPANAVNIRSKRCECGAYYPSFGLSGEPKSAARWCSKCPSKPRESVDIVKKRCECGLSQPIFGLPGAPWPAARWCSKCPSKSTEAVDVRKMRCECGLSCSDFRLPGEPKSAARWCTKCPSKPAQAVNTATKRSQDCKSAKGRPKFGRLPKEQSSAAGRRRSPAHNNASKPRSSSAVNPKRKVCECGCGFTQVPRFIEARPRSADDEGPAVHDVHGGCSADPLDPEDADLQPEDDAVADGGGETVWRPPKPEPQEPQTDNWVKRWCLMVTGLDGEDAQA